MASTCEALGERYARESGDPIPANNDNVDALDTWLFRDVDRCIDSDGKFTDAEPPCSSTQVHGFKQDGFIAWLNERGFQCVNKITGRIHDPDKPPGPSQAPPKSACSPQCLQYNSKTCMDCVQQILKDDPNRCPTSDVNTVSQCVECMDRMADVLRTVSNRTKGDETKNGVYMLSEKKDVPDSHVVAVMDTVRGKHISDSTGLSASEVAIIISSVLGFLIIVYLGYKIWRQRQGIQDGVTYASGFSSSTIG